LIISQAKRRFTANVAFGFSIANPSCISTPWRILRQLVAPIGFIKAFVEMKYQSQTF
jgi:hypothetical protein